MWLKSIADFNYLTYCTLPPLAHKLPEYFTHCSSMFGPQTEPFNNFLTKYSATEKEYYIPKNIS